MVTNLDDLEDVIRQDLTLGELFVAQAISSRNLKRELCMHLSFKMHWKLLYAHS